MGAYVPRPTRTGGWIIVPPTGQGRVWFAGGVKIPDRLEAGRAIAIAAYLNAWAGLT